jgi:Tc5 transposase DNA-binding domain
MTSKSTSSSKKSTVPKAPTKKGSAKHQGCTQKDLDNAVAACDPRNPDRITIPKAVVCFGVPKTTIRNHVLGKMSRSEAHEDRQMLTPEEETALANYCQLRGYRGVPLGKQEIIGLATELCGHKVGKNWIYGFQKRHPELKF